jgi:hypothetical protein
MVPCVIDWDAVDMAVERGRQEFERRLERGLKELNQRLAKVERRWEKEESQHYHDGLLRKMAVMTNMQVGAPASTVKRCGSTSRKAEPSGVPLGKHP